MGMNTRFQIVTPTRTQDAIWEAVELAIEDGHSPKDFMEEARECWAERLREKAKLADDEFKELAKCR